jgi:hypothetical protein
MKQSESIARKVVAIGSVVAVLAFLCGFVGTKYMVEQGKSVEIEDLASRSSAPSTTNKMSYSREFRLWENIDIKDENEWPEAINKDEEEIHSKRFDGVLPSVNAEAHVFVDSSTTDKDGEGGRRLAGSEHNIFENPIEQQTKQAEKVTTLTLRTYNSYTKDRKIQNSEYPWQYIVEPYRATTLELLNTNSKGSYRWTIDDHIHGYGTSVDALFSQLGYHDVKIEEMITNDDGSRTTNELVVKVMCKYVRREIRSMTDVDREVWFSAVAVMQHVPTSVGQAIYGPKYLSKDGFTRIHLYYGGAMDCDHWHQGAGFVTSHVAMTLQWEQSLQAINPSIAAPFWDFTLESTFYGSRDFRTSIVFSDDWFGEASPDNDLHTVTKGRFQFVATLLDAKKFSHWTNSYSMLRGPWNNDPTPFLTRSAKIYGYSNNMKPSGCREYRVALQRDNWMAMSRQLNSAAHGHIHELMGGAWNHYLKETVDEQSSPAVYSFAHAMQTLSKILWRYDYVRCPESCSMIDSAADCQCTCSEDSLKGKTALEILTETNILPSVPFFDNGLHKLDATNFLDENGDPANPIPGYSVEQTKHIHNKILALLCNPGHIGDMYQATSSNDITFWLIHLTVDRLWHYKRLGNTNNYDETWDPYHTCYGHNPAHYQPFKDLFTNDDENPSILPGHYYTNMDLYENLHPARRTLQYVYDDFKWDHCAKIGAPFSNA